MSARDAFLRAYTYHRSARAFMDPPTDDRFAAQLEHARSCFRRAAALSDPVIERVGVRFDAHTLPGYFVGAGTMSAPAKTLVVVGGEGTFAEDLYGYIGSAATSRGYNLFVVDLPGQGDLPSHGLVMRPDAEAPIGAALDYVTRRADVDERVSRSWGSEPAAISLHGRQRSIAEWRRASRAVSSSTSPRSGMKSSSRRSPHIAAAQTETREANPTSPPPA
jgi:hypothetical protein